MEIAFEAIGLEIPNEKAFHNLAEDVGKRGEVSRLPRKSGVLHGRCWKIGEGLEVWTVLYESETGEVFYADCRPGFRARFSLRVSPWIMTEYDEEGEAVIHGFIEDTEREVLFALQNLTEADARAFQQNALTVGLCGLAYRAEILPELSQPFWKSYDELALNVVENENYWRLCGEIISFKTLRNPFTGSDLFWIYLDLGDFNLEILVNQRMLSGEELYVGAFLKADVWLQGHIVKESAQRSVYEGVDTSVRTVDFWKSFKRVN
jgi:hypothetical protein